jgi:hypothetical protein
MSLRLLPDDRLKDQCREDVYRSGGPGGQKRNKSSNAVRLVHEPTGIIATAADSRSLRDNRVHALRRLRLKLAADLREPVDLPAFAPPPWFLAVRKAKGIALSTRNALFPAVAGLVLDLLDALSGNPAAVAINLGVSTSAVIKLLESEPSLWAAASRIRAAAGLGPLSHRG